MGLINILIIYTKKKIFSFQANNQLINQSQK